MGKNKNQNENQNRKESKSKNKNKNKYKYKNKNKNKNVFYNEIFSVTFSSFAYYQFFEKKINCQTQKEKVTNNKVTVRSLDMISGVENEKVRRASQATWVVRQGRMRV